MTAGVIVADEGINVIDVVGINVIDIVGIVVNLGAPSGGNRDGRR